MSRQAAMADVPTRPQIAASFDAIAKEFDASRIHPWPETFLFATQLPTASRVLDLGCGNARNWGPLAGRGHRVVGLDASRGLLQRAATKVGTSALVQGDAVELPVRSAAFDGVHCVAAVHHLPSEVERRQTAREIARVLRPGGTVLLSAWAWEQPRFAGLRNPDVEVPWVLSDGRRVARFYHLFQTNELQDLASVAGLMVIRAWREGGNHVLLASKKQDGTLAAP